jgi:ABC-type cobalamin/Fe3+-siderophores transport system ATPase subunit
MLGSYLEKNVKKYSIIRELKDIGKTIVMVIHDLNSALTYSDKICLIDRGQIVIHDTPKAVYNSREIERIFHVNCDEVYTDRIDQVQYVFSI